MGGVLMCLFVLPMRMQILCGESRREATPDGRMEAILRAARVGDEAQVMGLLDADPMLLERTDREWNRAVTVAAQHGQLGVVKGLLQRGANINATGRLRMTALHWAAEEGHVQVVAFLLGEGAQPSSMDPFGMTPLISASLRGHLPVVQLLMRRLGREGLEERGNSGITALHWAARQGHEEVVAFLKSKGPQAATRDQDGMTPLMWASDRGHVGVVRLLLEHMGPGELDERNDEGSTALHLAAREGHGAVAALLLGRGADPNPKGRDGTTPLMWACGRCHVGVVTHFLKHVGRKELDGRSEDGSTALHWAARGGQEEVVRLLLLSGATSTVRNNAFKTPLALAREKDHAGPCVAVLQVSLRLHSGSEFRILCIGKMLRQGGVSSPRYGPMSGHT